MSAYIKLESKWVINTAKALLSLVDSKSLLKIEIDKDVSQVTFCIDAYPSSYRRSGNTVQVASAAKESFFYVSAQPFLSTLSKLPASTKKYEVFVGIRFADATANITCLGGKKTNLSYSFSTFVIPGGDNIAWTLADAEPCFAVVSSWALASVMKKLKRVREIGSGNSVSGFNITSVPGPYFVRVTAFTNHLSISADLATYGGDKKKNNTVSLGLESAHELTTVLNTLKPTSHITAFLNERNLKINADELMVTIGAIENKIKPSSVDAIFSKAKTAAYICINIDTEQLKGVMDRLDVISKANPDNLHKVTVDFSTSYPIIEGDEQIGEGCQLKISSNGYGVGGGSESVDATIEYEKVSENPTGKVYVNATRFNEVLKSSDWTSVMKIFISKNAMLFQWTEYQKADNEEDEKEMVMYEAALGLLKE